MKIIRRTNMRPKQAQQITLLARYEYGTCKCGGRVLYYSDLGVRCESCGKLVGVYHPEYKPNPRYFLSRIEN